MRHPGNRGTRSLIVLAVCLIVIVGALLHAVATMAGR